MQAYRPDFSHGFPEIRVQGKLVSVFKSAKQAVPPSNVPIIKSVDIKLMMNGVMFRTLNKVTNPTGSAQIAVVNILAQHGEDIEPGASGGASSKDQGRTIILVESSGYLTAKRGLIFES